MNSILTSLRAILILTAITCGAYPLIVTGLAHVLFPAAARGSLLTDSRGDVIGSRLIGQSFTSDDFFHPRPSAAGSGYDAASSGGTNLSARSPVLHDAINERIQTYRRLNQLADDTPVPVDAVTSSASGLDPHISVENAELQASRVAQARNISLMRVKELISAHTATSFFGPPTVNVLQLNLEMNR
jgi:potassium-transporting ATPase KdpC subunit